MALAVAIFALVVVAALVAGAFFAGNLEQRTGRNTVYASEAADAAESGVSSVFANWDPALNGLAVGDSLTEPVTSLGARITVTPNVVRLNDELFLVRSLGQRADASGRTLAQRTVAVVGRLVTLTSAARATVTVTRPIAFGGNGFVVIGNDSVPAGWAACAPLSDQAGIRSAAATGTAARDTSHVSGNPPQVANDSTVTSAVFGVLGQRTFDQLKASASVVVAGTAPYAQVAPSLAGSAGRCNAADSLNWGEPHRSGTGYVSACAARFPIIYGSGARLRLTGGRGQGLLLVEGNLEVDGGFEFTGLIIARGGIRLSGRDNRITGAVLAQGAGLDGGTSIGGGTTLQYSSCAVAKALQAAASAEPLTQRSWVQIY